MSMIRTTYTPLRDDLCRELRRAPDGDCAEAWIDGAELYLLIRLCLLARDRRRDGGHGSEADDLFGALVAEYARRGEYTAVTRGRLIYHAPSLADVTATLPLEHAR